MGERILLSSIPVLLIAGAVMIACCGGLVFMGWAVTLDYYRGSLAPHAVGLATFVIIVVLPAWSLFRIWRALGLRHPLAGLQPSSIVGPALTVLGIGALLRDSGDWFVYLPVVLLGTLVWLCGVLARKAQRQFGV